MMHVPNVTVPSRVIPFQGRRRATVLTVGPRPGALDDEFTHNEGGYPFPQGLEDVGKRCEIVYRILGRAEGYANSGRLDLSWACLGRVDEIEGRAGGIGYYLRAKRTALAAYVDHLAGAAGEPVAVVRSLVQLARMADARERHAAAAMYLLQGLALVRDCMIDSPELLYELNCQRTLNARARGDHPSVVASANCLVAHAMANGGPYQFRVAAHLFDLGCSEHALGDCSEARSHLTAAERICKGIKGSHATRLRVDILLRLSLAHQEQGGYEAATASLQRARAILKKSGEVDMRAVHVFSASGGLAAELGDRRGAIRDYQRALEVLKSLQLPDWLHAQEMCRIATAIDQLSS